MSGIKLTGDNVLAKKMKRLERTMFHAAKAAILQEAEMIMTESRSLVPVDKGILKTSGVVGKPKKIRGGAGVEVIIGYGGAASSYAIYVHEDLNANHVVGQALFLELPFQKAQFAMSYRLSLSIKRILGLGV